METMPTLTLQSLTTFFLWCTILSMGLMIFWVIIYMLMPNTVYKLQNRFFPMARETWNITFYCFLGFYKVLVILLFLIPLIVLLIMS